MAWSILANKEQQKGLKRGAGVVQQYYQQARADLAPYREAGQWAIQEAQKTLQGGIPAYSQTPEYTYSFNQGIRAMRENAAVSGNLDTSSFNKQLYRFGENEALNDVDRFYSRWLNTRFNPLMQLAGAGQSATSQTAQLAQNTGESLANIEVSKGNSRAGMYNSLGGTIMGAAQLGAGLYGNAASSGMQSVGTGIGQLGNGSVGWNPNTAGIAYGTNAYNSMGYQTPFANVNTWGY